MGLKDPSPLRPYLLSPLYLDLSQGHKSGQPFLARPAPGTRLLYRRGEPDLGGHVWGGSLLKHPEAMGRRPPPRSHRPSGLLLSEWERPRSGRRDLNPRQAAAGPGVKISPLPRHPPEDKAAVIALAGLRQGLSGGRGQEAGVRGAAASGEAPRASAETCQMPGERQSALAPRGPARAWDGKSQERWRLCPSRALALHPSSLHNPPPPASPAPKIQCVR